MLKLRYMDNKEIAKILYEISEYLAMDDVPFKPRAYEKSALVIEGLERGVGEIYKKEGIKGLENIPTVGKGIAEVIEELVKTGKSKIYEKLKKKTPVDLSGLTSVEGIGPKSILKLYKELGIKTINDLEKAAKAKKIRNIESFGQKSEQNILMAIGFLKGSSGKFPLGHVLQDIRRIEEKIANLRGVKKAVIAGSIRRMKEVVGDADLLATVSSSKTAKEVMAYFINMPEVAHVYSCGPTRSSVKLKNYIDCDLRVVPEKSFGAALQYFTGSKDHNIELRKIAIKKGLKLNEYGLFKIKNQKSKIKINEEKDIYEALGLQYIEPELRENAGEIEASLSGKLPRLINYNDLMGDLQMHSTWSDGQNSIEEMAKKAIQIDLKYIVITDHIRGSFDHKIGEKELLAQGKEIDKINGKISRLTGSRSAGQNSFKILKGGEVDILNDGKLFMKDEVLKKLDVVGASIHTNFKMPKTKMTERIIRAMKNPHVDILFHPTGRLIQSRPAYEVDMEKVIRAAKETKTALEITSFFNRLDLKDEYVRMAKDAGVKIAINSDAHSVSHFQYLELGIAQARRGWLERKDVINAWPMEKMLKMLK
jgi:DNA polymerase (family 10)